MKYLEILGEKLAVKTSYSFLTKANCPRLLRKNYIEKPPEKTVRVAAERGKAAHRVAEELTTHVLDEGMDVQDIHDELLVESVERHTPYVISSEIGDILEWLKLWRDRFVLRRHELVEGVEAKLSIDDAYDECTFDEASYRGVLDLFFLDRDHAIVYDWKSQPNILGQGDLDKQRQFTFYCWLIWKIYPHITRFTAYLWYFRYGFAQATTRTIDDLTTFEDFLILRERKISEIESWDPIAGKHCGYCDYMHDCPLALDLSPDNPRIINQDQAVLAAQRITVMEALTKALKDGLKTYVKKNDEIMMEDRWVYGYKPGTSIFWKLPEVLPVLEAHGHELSEFTNMNNAGIKKIIKTAKKEEEMGFAAELEGLSHEKKTTKFQGYQKPPE